MEKPADNVASAWVEIGVRFNPLTSEFSLTGCDANPVVALGMLDYALSRIRRSLVQGDLQREIQNAPRVSLAGGIPS